MAKKPRPEKKVVITPTDRENLFIEFYLGEAYLNAAKAARLAGYKQAAQEGYRLKKRNRVAEAIKKRLEEAAMPTEEILKRMADYSRATFAPFMYGDDDEGAVVVDRDLDPIEVRAAKELLKRTETKDAPSEPDRLSWNDPTPEEIEEANRVLKEIAAKESDGAATEVNFRLDTRAARANIHLLKEVKVSRHSTKTTKKSGEVVEHTTTQLSFKIHDQMRATMWLGQAAGLIKDSGSELMKTIDVSRLSTRQLQRLAAGEDLLKILLSPDGADATGEASEPVEDDLPPALPENGATGA